MSSREKAEKLKEILETPFVNEILSKIKTTASNSIKFLKYIPIPKDLIGDLP
jgi:hypothetical protein